MPAEQTFECAVQYARQFGPEFVLEMVPPEQRPRLQIELDAIEAARPRRRFETVKRRRRSPEETVAVVATLRAEGLVPTAIATKLSLTDAYVRKCLNAARKPARLSGKSGTETESKGNGHA